MSHAKFRTIEIIFLSQYANICEAFVIGVSLCYDESTNHPPPHVGYFEVSDGMA